MKTKRFFQLHFVPWSFWIILLIPMIAGIIVFPDIVNDYIRDRNSDDLESIIAIVVLNLFFSYIIVLMEHLHFTFRDETISMTDDWFSKNRKVQFKTVVRYDDITDISLVLSTNNSQNKRIRSAEMQSSLTKVYLQLTTRSGKNEWMYIKYFTKRQKLKIIRELLRRMEKVGNHSVTRTPEDIVKENEAQLYIW